MAPRTRQARRRAAGLLAQEPADTGNLQRSLRSCSSCRRGGPHLRRPSDQPELSKVVEPDHGGRGLYCTVGVGVLLRVTGNKTAEAPTNGTELNFTKCDEQEIRCGAQAPCIAGRYRPQKYSTRYACLTNECTNRRKIQPALQAVFAAGSCAHTRSSRFALSWRERRPRVAIRNKSHTRINNQIQRPPGLEYHGWAGPRAPAPAAAPAGAARPVSDSSSISGCSGMGGP